MNQSELKIIYGWVQLLGFLIQIMPIIFLFFAPYRQNQMRVYKRKLLTGLCIAGVLFSLFCAALTSAAYLEPGFSIRVRTFGNAMFLLFLAVGTVVYFFSLKKEVQCKILTYVMVLQYAVFLYTTAEMGAKFTAPLPQEFQFSPYSINSIVMYVLVTAATYPWLYSFLKHLDLEESGQGDKKSILLISVSSVGMFIAFVAALQSEMLINDLHSDSVTKVCLNIWLLSMIVINLLAYYNYFRCLQIEKEKEAANMRLMAGEMQYDALQDKFEAAKKRQHNIRHHFRTLASLAEEQRYEELDKYLKTYLEGWEKSSSRTISRNAMINSILSYYLSQAEEKGITVETDINVKEKYPFYMPDMTVLLGNAMENAVEACCNSEIEAPFIRIMIKQVKQSILIKIENSTRQDGGPVMGGKRHKSTKQNREHGYGLASMEMVVKKYQGGLEFWKSENVFVLRAALNIPEDKEEKK